MTDLGKELDMVREKWTKSREEAAKTEEEMIMAKALLKQKEAELNQAMEVCIGFRFRYTLSISTFLRQVKFLEKLSN